MEVVSEQHLWDVEHPYYCNEGNYFANDCCQRFTRWCDFVESEGDSDMDMNLVFRWDWEWSEHRNPDPYMRDGTLKVFFMGQRKGLFRSCVVDVCEADEPEVRKYLQPRLEHLMKLWAPLTSATVPVIATGADK